jgi:hypothetical protein
VSLDTVHNTKVESSRNTTSKRHMRGRTRIGKLPSTLPLCMQPNLNALALNDVLQICRCHWQKASVQRLSKGIDSLPTPAFEYSPNRRESPLC